MKIPIDRVADRLGDDAVRPHMPRCRQGSGHIPMPPSLGNALTCRWAEVGERHFAARRDQEGAGCATGDEDASDLPSAFTEAERDAGYRCELLIPQAEFSWSRGLDQPCRAGVFK
jgi:hypothetical protein